jgi:cellulose synthase/poly-beta-1,6-N-acetylglucosamine synthase-like glycosyltransferase
MPLLALYAVFLMYLIIAMTFKKEAKTVATPDDAPGISIVIPFKNEAHHLPALLDSLIRQDYSGRYEILLVNDGSTDDYEKTLSPYCLSAPRPIKIISSRYDKTIHLTSKQQALDAGATAASFEWLLFTDADMEFQINWVASMARMASHGHDMVFGHTALRKKSQWGLFDAMQSYQLEFLFAVAHALNASKLTGSCMGNNLLVKKEPYRAMGGQKEVGYSIVEDCDLLRAFKRKGYSIGAAEPFVPEAYTFPCKSITDFMSQALRWGRGGLRIKSGLFPLWALFCFQNLLFLLSCAFLVPRQLEIVAFANALLTVVFIYGSFKKIHSSESFFLLPVYYIFFMVETVTFLAATIIVPGLSWKGRKL